MAFQCCNKNCSKEQNVSQVYDFLQVIADKNRLRILCLLQDEAKCVCEIFPVLGISQKLASHHLGQLKKLSLLEEKREGNFVRHCVNKAALKDYKHMFDKLIK